MSENTQMGIILRIAVENFVTYDNVVIRPGKGLNLIIGANGTGKSTIVSAIVLGLGGNCKVIGRATQISHFVRAGQKSGSIEIDLQSGTNKFVTIKRTFDMENHSHWFVNNKAANNKQIKEVMQSFNIQVDNLCQFLPQDKVQDFSNLSPHHLLLETQRSVGDPKLLEYHSQLKELRVKQMQLETELERSTKLQASEKQAYDLLKDKVGHINEQEKIKKKLKTLKQKKAWILYQNKRDEFMKAKTLRDQAIKKKKKVEDLLKPIVQEIAKLKHSIQSLEVTLKQHKTDTAAKSSRLNAHMDNIDKLEKSIDECQDQCEQAIREEQQCDERINEMKINKNKLENDLVHLINVVGTVEKLQNELQLTNPKVNELRETATQYKAQQNDYKQQLDNVNRKLGVEEQNLKAVQDIENRRLELLRKLSSDAYKGVTWLRSNSHLFNHTIHEPMILKINLKNAEYSKYFERIIPLRDLTAFVCEDKNDMNLLIKYLRDQQKLKINAVHSDPNKHVDDQPSIPLKSIQQFGFEHYLVSLIEAPRTILNYIISMYRINDIPIGNDKVAMNLEHIPDNLFRFFSTNNSYSVSRSKYTHEKSTRQAAIHSRGLMSITVDTVRVKQLKNEIVTLNEKREELIKKLELFPPKIASVFEQLEMLKHSRSELQNNLRKIKDTEFKIKVNDESIASAQSGRRSIDEIRSMYKTEIQNIIRQQLQVYEQYNNTVDDCYKNIILSEEIKLQIKLKKNMLAVKENSITDLKEELSNHERNCKLIESELQPLKHEVSKLFTQAKESTGGLSYDNPEFKPIKSAFAKLPASIEEIFEEIQTTQAKIFCLSNDQEETRKTLERFNTLKKRLENFDEIIKTNDEQLSQITQEMETIKDKWYPELSGLVDQINNNFSTYFKKMNCAGEVTLTNGENVMDFDKYGLKIKVKFRDSDELQVLTRTHQSGGERAVTTAVYMLALQELTRVPFRCVDEINQGMDATNERRIFELIVNITSKCNGSQYFLLTPKLLPGLKYNDTVTVLTVFNGQYMVPSSEFDMNQYCAKIIESAIRTQTEIM